MCVCVCYLFCVCVYTCVYVCVCVYLVIILQLHRGKIKIVSINSIIFLKKKPIRNVISKLSL